MIHHRPKPRFDPRFILRNHSTLSVMLRSLTQGPCLLEDLCFPEDSPGNFAIWTHLGLGTES